MNSTNPFPGLRPFEGNESHLFFGRERHINEIIRKMDSYHFVSIVGNSGSGKSSLVRAGLLPFLANERKGCQVCTMRPGDNPLLSLEKALLEDKLINHADGELEGSKLGLVQLLRHELTDGKQLLLLVDQFEELFRYNTIYSNKELYNRACQFVDLLLAAAEQRDVPIFVIITLRSDFLGDCEQFIGLPEAINNGQFLVPRMNRAELQSTLVEPVHLEHAKISPRLVQNLLSEVGNSQDQLPVLQHALMRTFEAWKEAGKPEQPIDLEHYESIGGMKDALSLHAEEAYNPLNSKQQKLAEVIFKTVTSKGGNNRGVRRPTSVKKIAAIAETDESEVIKVVDVFRRQDKGFLTPSGSSTLNANSIIDISHESLMRKWDKLKKWVEEEASSAELYIRICENAILYEKDKASLWGDPDLQIAKDWLEVQKPNEAWAKQYNEHFNNAVRFIEASNQQKAFLLQEKTRKRRVRNASAIIVLIVLSILSFWALTERNSATTYAQEAIEKKQEADEQRKRAESSLGKAMLEEQKANDQKLEAEHQKQLAEGKAIEARDASLIAQQEAERSKIAEASAQKEREKAIRQTIISDSLRSIAEIANKESEKLRLLSVAQNLAIRSTLLKEESVKELKALLAIQAYQFNAENGGKEIDGAVFESVFSAYRLYQNNSQYLFRDNKDAVNAVVFTDNETFVSACSDGSLVSSTINSSKKQTYANPNQVLDKMAYNDKDKLLAVANGQEHILVFNATNLNVPKHTVITEHLNKIVDVLWLDNKIASLSADSTLQIHAMDNTASTQRIKLKFKPKCGQLDKPNNRLLIGGVNGHIYSLNLIDFEVSTFFRSTAGSINSLAVDATGNKIAYGTSTGFSELLNANGKQLNHVLAGHEAGVSAIEFDQSGLYVATASWDGKVRLFVLDQPNQPAIDFIEHTSWVLDLAFNPNAQLLASASKDKSVILYPVSLDTMVTELQAKVSRTLTKEEWALYVGAGIPYYK